MSVLPSGVDLDSNHTDSRAGGACRTVLDELGDSEHSSVASSAVVFLFGSRMFLCLRHLSTSI